MTTATGAPPRAASIPAAARSDPRLARLAGIIDRQSLLRGDFTLSSGRKSNYLFQLRQTTLHPEGALLISQLLIEFMRAQSVSCLGGLVQGAVPIVSAVAPVSHQMGYPVDVFFVRKETKQHGAKERIDGYLARDREVLLVDDVATTGNSFVETAAGIREAGYRRPLGKAIVIVDREEGATEALAAQGIQLFSLFRKSEFRI